MNILLLGAAGQLGSELVQNRLHVIYAYTRNNLDISQITVEDMLALLRKHSIDAVINAAAYTAVDKAENNAETACAINAHAVAVIARACALLRVRLIHISTDYVFDGKSNTPYKTHDNVSPLNVYGASKAQGEALLFQYNADAVCLRTAWLYSVHGSNFVKTMLRMMQAGNVVRVVNDQTGAPAWTKDVADCIWKIMAMPEVKGLLHWTGAGQCSWFEFALAIQQGALRKGLLTDLADIIPVPASEYQTAATRPAYSVLDCQSTAQCLQIVQRHWKDALDAMLDEMVLLRHL